jgi:hypothetical protein
MHFKTSPNGRKRYDVLNINMICKKCQGAFGRLCNPTKRLAAGAAVKCQTLSQEPALVVQRVRSGNKAANPAPGCSILRNKMMQGRHLRYGRCFRSLHGHGGGEESDSITFVEFIPFGTELIFNPTRNASSGLFNGAFSFPLMMLMASLVALCNSLFHFLCRFFFSFALMSSHSMKLWKYIINPKS